MSKMSKANWIVYGNEPVDCVVPAFRASKDEATAYAHQVLSESESHGISEVFVGKVTQVQRFFLKTQVISEAAE